MHRADAKDRGLHEGQTVSLKNARGECLAELRLTLDIRRGVIQMATGAWFVPEGQRCVGGNPNVLTPDQATSRLAQGPIAHTCLTEVTAAKV